MVAECDRCKDVSVAGAIRGKKVAFFKNGLGTCNWRYRQLRIPCPFFGKRQVLGDHPTKKWKNPQNQ